MPLGTLQDLIAIEQIKHEGAKRAYTPADDEAEFWRLMGYK